MRTDELTVLLIIIFITLLIGVYFFIRLDKHLKGRGDSEFYKKMGITYYLFELPFYKIRNEFKQKKIWHKIKGELSRFKYWDNYKLCKQYPFLKRYNVWTGAFCGYAYTWYDGICRGWQIAFGKKLLREIAKACGNDKKRMKKEVQFSTIKEKYGSLRLYANATRAVQCVLDKYEYLSAGYCIYCGKPARYETTGWISYMCEDCFRKHYLSCKGIKFSKRYRKYNRELTEEEKKEYETLKKECSLKDYKPSGEHSTLCGKCPEILDDMIIRKACGEVWNFVKEEKVTFDDGTSYISRTYEFDTKASYGITVEELWGCNTTDAVTISDLNKELRR